MAAPHTTETRTDYQNIGIINGIANCHALIIVLRSGHFIGNCSRRRANEQS